MTQRKIRIIHPITRMIIGGAQENTMLTAALLEQVARERAGNAAGDAAWDVTVYCGPQTGPEGSLIETTQALGVDLRIEPSMVREINPLQDLRCLWRLTRYLRRERAQIVHTHSSKAGMVGRWAARLAGVPVIVHTVHGWGHHDRQHPLVRNFYIWLEKRTLPITDRLIVVSERDIEKGVQDGIGTPHSYTVIRSGIELERFGHPQVPRAEMRASLGIPADAPLIGSVTRLSAQKAPLDFVRAAGRVAQIHPEVHFVMVGDGPLRPHVEALAAELGIAERLVLTGLRRDVPELLATFDIFVLSSLWEGLPRVLPQAMATALPVVATAIDGNAEIVRDGVNGLLTPPGDPPALADALLRLLADPDLARRMGEAGRAGVDEFGAVRMVEQIAELYRHLLREKGLLEKECV